MFRVSLSVLFVCYLILILSLLFAVWIAGDWRRKRNERLVRKYRLACNICGAHYEDKTSDPIPACPACGALNERVSLSDL